LITKVVVGGATGKLGRMVCDMIAASEDLRLTGATVSENGGNIGREISGGIVASGPMTLKKLLEDADVYVDLTTPSAASATVASVPGTGTNLVLGTTAVDAATMETVTAAVREHGTSAVVSANFAVGINVFLKVCEILAGYLPEYDVEIIEAHHSSKKDSPSGTAKEALRRLQAVTGIEKTSCGREGISESGGREIGVHSVRAGGIVGDHTVLFGNSNEVIELTNRAISREALASGCLRTIRWVAGRKDGKVHSMSEVLGL